MGPAASARASDPQPLPGGQAVRCPVEVVAQIDGLERLDGPRSCFVGVEAADRETELDVLAGGQERDEVAHLVDDADTFGAEPGEAVPVEAGEVGTERLDAALAGRSRPATKRSNVVLPLPDGPVTTWKRPARKATLVDGRPSIEVDPAP